MGYHGHKARMALVFTNLPSNYQVEVDDAPGQGQRQLGGGGEDGQDAFELLPERAHRALLVPAGRVPGKPPEAPGLLQALCSMGPGLPGMPVVSKPSEMG